MPMKWAGVIARLESSVGQSPQKVREEAEGQMPMKWAGVIARLESSVGLKLQKAGVEREIYFQFRPLK